MKEVDTISDALRVWDVAHALQSVSVQTMDHQFNRSRKPAKSL